jgi:hypothetical protein
MGIIALWYVGIFAAVMVALQIIFKVTGVDIGVTFLLISDISTRLYMLAIGIVCPLVYFNHYISAGVTRKQFFAGMVAAGTALSLCFTILKVPLLILGGEFSLLAMLVCVLYGTLTFIVGWTASVGFQHMRFIPIVVGIVLAPLMWCGLLTLERLQLPLLAHLWIFISAILVAGTGLLLAVWRVPVRC